MDLSQNNIRITDNVQNLKNTRLIGSFKLKSGGGEGRGVWGKIIQTKLLSSSALVPTQQSWAKLALFSIKRLAKPVQQYLVKY